MKWALVASHGPARPCGAGLASSGLAIRHSPVTWFGVLPSSTRWGVSKTWGSLLARLGLIGLADA